MPYLYSAILGHLCNFSYPSQSDKTILYSKYVPGHYTFTLPEDILKGEVRPLNFNINNGLSS